MLRTICFAAATITVALFLLASSANADPVTLQNPTATFSQTSFGGFSIAGTLSDPTSTSWAIFDGGTTNPQTAVWETLGDIGILGGTLLSFTITHTDASFGNSSQPNLGRFRLSYTTDDRSLFADGLSAGGDVTANWVILNPISFTSDGGSTATELGDLSLLVSGGAAVGSEYTITSITTATGITGFRLEALEDPSLPGAGPGRANNGNFHISLFEVDASAVPEPSSLMMLSGLALGSVFTQRRRRTPNGT